MTHSLPSYLQQQAYLYRLQKAKYKTEASPVASLLDFTTQTYPQYKSEPFHIKLAETLDRVVSGEVKRLMIFAPPQHGKSELTSVRLPAYWLGKRPDDPVIIASYAADLAYSKSRQARTIVESDEYRALFSGVTTRADSRAVNHWSLAQPHRGGLLAVGVGGPITGHGAMLGIIDDPIENWEQAQSETIRNKAWEWYRSTFRTRIWEDGAIILIMTRWHEDDLAGRIINTPGDEWTILRLPAIAETQAERDRNNEYLGLPTGERDPIGREPGEALSPQRFSAAYLQSLRSEGNVGSLAFAAEYQGVPRPAEGNRFKREWFPIVDALPVGVKRVRYWDKGGTDDGGTFTAGVLVALHPNGTIYVEDVVRGQWSAGKRETVMKQTAMLDKPRLRDGEHYSIYVEQEPGSGGKESAQASIVNLQGFAVYRDLPTGDKDTRLEPFAAQAEAGNVRLLRGDWNRAYIEEMISIPNGTYRDQADATAGAFNRLAGRRAITVETSKWA